MSDISDLLDELDAAREKATPGPWRTGGSGVVAGLEYVAQGVRTDPDAALIVAAVNALPRLVAALRAVEALVEHWNGDGALPTRNVRAAISAALMAAGSPS